MFILLFNYPLYQIFFCKETIFSLTNEWKVNILNLFKSTSQALVVMH